MGDLEVKVMDLEILCFNLLNVDVSSCYFACYWSEVLCCIIMTHLSDLEVKVMGHRF